MPKLKEILFGKKDKLKKYDTQSPQQQELFDLLLKGLQGEGPYAEMFKSFDADDFQRNVSDPALKNFQENILPAISEKFIGGGQVGGSGMLRAQNKAGTDLQAQLAMLMNQAQQQGKQFNLQGLQTALGTPTQGQFIQGGSQGIVPGLVQSAAQTASKMAGASIAG